MSQPTRAGSDTTEIVLLADYSEAVRVIAAGYVAEWDFWYGSGKRGNARSDLLERSQPNALPLGLVARRAGKFIAAVALAEKAISVRPELTPCLIGLWVAPEARKRGVGSALLREGICRAAQM